MATDVRIIAGGVTNYLVNSSGSPTIGGAATAASTTPFAIFNDQWTIQTAQPLAAYQGGPPIKNGADLAYQAYANTQQSIPCSVEGSSHDNTVALLRSLRQLLNQTLSVLPAVLYYQPNGATNPLYFEIQSGAIQEKPEPLNPTGGFAYIEFDLLLTLKPFGGRLSTGETLMSGLTFTNTGTGANNNTQAFSAGAGDLIWEGQPLNLSLTVSAAGGLFYVGSVYNRTYSTGGAGAFSTSSTTGFSPTSFTLSAALDPAIIRAGLSGRFLARFTSPASNVRLSYRVVVGSTLLYWSPWIDPDNNSTLIDFGGFDLNAIRRAGALTSSDISVEVYYKSSDGASAAATLVYSEFLLYYDFCVIDSALAGVSTSETLRLISFPEQTNIPCLPNAANRAHTILTAGGKLNNIFGIRGTAPRYYSGASLYLAWLDFSTRVHTTTRTATVTVTHAPLWFAMRGSQ